MRRLCLALLLLLAPAHAELVLSDLKVSKPGACVTIKATVSNPGPELEKGTGMKLSFFIRPEENAPWEPFKVWVNLPDLKPGEKVCRAFQVTGDDRIRRLAARPNCQIKARLQAGERVAELIRSQHASASP